MSSARIKRILFVGLLLAFSGIWLYNLSIFLPKSEGTYYRSTSKAKSSPDNIVKASVFDFAWGYKLDSKLSDPFIPFYKKNAKRVTNQHQPEIIPEIVTDHPYRYIGYLQGKAKSCGILTDRLGKSYVVVPGDTLAMTKIIKVYQDSLKLEYQGKIFIIELNE